MAHYFSLDASGEVPAWFLATITPSAIAGYIGNPSFNYLVGFAGPALAGIVAVRDGAHIHHLFVASEFHHGGVAAALWQRAKADALASEAEVASPFVPASSPFQFMSGSGFASRGRAKNRRASLLCP